MDKYEIDYIGGDLKSLWLNKFFEYKFYYEFLKKEIFKPGKKIFVGNKGWLDEMERDDIAKIERFGVILYIPYTFAHNFNIFCSPEDSCYSHLFAIVDCLFDIY